MRVYSNLKAIPLSIYSRELYQDVAHRWAGMGFGYLFLLIGLLSVPFTLFAVFWATTVTLDKPYDFNYLIDQIPEIRLHGGEASVAAPQPYFIKTKDEAEIIGIIDTTRPATEVAKEFTKSSVLFILGKNEVLTYESQKSEKRIYDLPKDEDYTLNRDIARELAQKLLGYAWIVPLFTAPFLVPFFFVYAILIMFVYGVIGLLFNLILRTGYSYGDCVRLACVSTTASTLLGCITMALSVHISGWAGFSIDMMYLLFAMWAAKQ